MLCACQDFEKGKHVNFAGLTTQLMERLVVKGPPRDDYEKMKAEVRLAPAVYLLERRHSRKWGCRGFAARAYVLTMGREWSVCVCVDLLEGIVESGKESGAFRLSSLCTPACRGVRVLSVTYK